MPEYEICNRAAFRTWRAGRNHIVGVKGHPPPGMTYSDGALVEGLVNVGWRDADTGEAFALRYREVRTGQEGGGA